MRRLERVMASYAAPAVLLVRLMVAFVFVTEGAQKFLAPDAFGSGRFAKIGIPWPALMGPFVGAIETAAGALVLIGLLTRLAAAALIVDMVVAIVSTKIPILLGHGFWGFTLSALPTYCFWSMAHESRTDISMLLGSLFLLWVGPGPWSLDVLLARRLR
jgi:putative oxidoreductase